MPTYILHWNPQHLSIGVVVAVTDEVLSDSNARQWALVEMGEHGVHPVASTWSAWERANHYDAWWTVDAISLSQYYLRHYSGEWYLLRILSRVEGGGPELGSRGEAIAWADNVLSQRVRGIVTGDWQAGPLAADASTLVKRA